MKDLSLSINLNDYNVSTTEFTNWVVEGNMDVYAIAAHGGNGSKLYFFQNIEDFTAFTLKFSKRLSGQVMGYKGKSNADASAYYAPYIPQLNEKDND
jgi:hypothetical protein